MRWLAHSPAPEQQYPWLFSQHDFSVTQAGRQPLSPIIRERLGYGQVVAVEGSLGYRFLIAGFHGAATQLRLSQPYRDIAVVSAQILRQHLNVASPEERKEVVERLTTALSVDVKGQGQATLPNDEVLERVYSRGLVFYFDNGKGQVLVQLADGELVQVVLPAPFNPWAWPVVLLLLVVSGSVLALSLVLVLRGWTATCVKWNQWPCELPGAKWAPV